MANKQKVVWLIEKDDDTAYPIINKLKSIGYKTRWFMDANDGIEAIKQITPGSDKKSDNDEKPDLIITDLNTGNRRNGLEVVKEAYKRSKEIKHNIKTIILTKNLSAEFSEKAKDAGATIVLDKGTDFEKLMLLVHELTKDSPNKGTNSITR